MKKIIIFLILFFLGISQVMAKGPKSKFYDFSDQLIDGQVKKPTALYTDARQRVRFERLLKLKKSFIPKLYNTAKEKVFK
tara:strand:+ start:785 stop:1024 length:240 start_codon:yes stop_codon:yes gene_type:complete